MDDVLTRFVSDLIGRRADVALDEVLGEAGEGTGHQLGSERVEMSIPALSSVPESFARRLAVLSPSASPVRGPCCFPASPRPSGPDA